MTSLITPLSKILLSAECKIKGFNRPSFFYLFIMFATKSEILGIIKFFRRNYTVDDISDDLQSMASSKIMGIMIRQGYFDLTADDDYIGLLKSAEIGFYLEFAGMTREIENAMGVIGEESLDGYTKKYENGMPMFFFASGGTEAFVQLLPHETWRMCAFRYVNDFITYYWATQENDGLVRNVPLYGSRDV